MTHSVIEDPFEERCTTVGKEYPFTEVKVLNPETGEECAVGEQGEMCCRGYLVMKGGRNVLPRLSRHERVL